VTDENWVPEDTTERVRGLYNYRHNRFASRFDGDPDGVEERSVAYQRLMVGSIRDGVMHRIERDLDLEEARLEV
jgi:monovalent cation/hydrogen antiporter